MVNNCNVNDIDRIRELGFLINSNFSLVNDIDELIKNNQIIGYYEDNSLVGFIIFSKLYEVIDILYIVVDPVYRRKGIGYELIKYLLDEFEYERVLLEVRCDNKNAIKLYDKFNFKIINIRENYYDGIDAYVMEMIK